MKKTLRCLLSFVCIACVSGPAIAAHTAEKKATKTAATHTNKTPAKAKGKTGTKATHKSETAKKTPPRSSIAASNNTVQTVRSCKTVRVKTARGYRTERQCSTTESALHSPIDANAISASASGGKQPELKARTIPDRAYAVDGYTFFHQGRKYRVIG